MTLKNDFFTIINSETGDEGIAYNVRLNPDHFIYKAHFPEMPVTPGVCIIQMALEILQEHCGEKLHLMFLKNVKFLSVISPEQDANISFVIHKFDTNLNVEEYKAVVSVEQGTAVKAKISMTCIKNAGKDK